jgi:phage gp46-like protein
MTLAGARRSRHQGFYQPGYHAAIASQLWLLRRQVSAQVSMPEMAAQLSAQALQIAAQARQT